MKPLRIMCMLLILGLTGSSLLLAQATGDYRSKATGKWSAAATWERYSGSAWVAASTAPTGTGTITLQNTDSVDVDAAVTITGTLKSTGGKVGNSASTLTFGSGGTYEHAINGGSIPLATWGTGSTLLITGVTGNAPSNGNQNFYNLTWNCPGQTAGLNLGMANNTIGGNVRVIACTTTPTTSVSAAFRLTAGNAPAVGVNVITIKGTVIVDSLGVFTASGSGSPTDTIVVRCDSSFTSRGAFNLANGSGATCNWEVKGDVRILGGVFGTHSSTTLPDSLIFAGTKTQIFAKAGSVTSLGNVRFGFRPGSMVSLDTNTVGTSGGSYVFVDSGATIYTGHRMGMEGNFPVGGTVTINPGAAVVYMGKTAQSDSLLPAAIRKLSVLNTAGFTLLQSTTVAGMLGLNAGPLLTGADTLTLGPAAGVALATGYVDGTLQRQFTSAGSLQFDVGTSGGYAPVFTSVTGGPGSLTVKAVHGSHASIFDSTKALRSYWTLGADAVTGATLIFQYPQADVRGNEAKYGAWKYSGSGTNWTALTCTVDTAKNRVTVSNVTSFSDWTVGESNSSTLVTGVGAPAPETIPSSFFVAQNYPNPFNPSTTITFGLPADNYVTVKVYNLLGQEITTLLAGQQRAGIHTLRFDASRLTSGMYLYRVQAGAFSDVRRMLLLK